MLLLCLATEHTILILMFVLTKVLNCVAPLLSQIPVILVDERQEEEANHTQTSQRTQTEYYNKL